MDSKVTGRHIHYLVKWKGYPEHHQWMWEPLGNLTHTDEAIISPNLWPLVESINMNDFIFKPIPLL
jgi:hypothetical protein